MNNFARALRVALRYRLNVAATVVCALAVAVLWGGNIGVLYPVVEVVFEGKTIGQWLDTRLVQSDQEIAGFEATRAALATQIAAAAEPERAKLQGQLEILSVRLDAETAAAARFRMLQPYVNRYLPTDPFQTLLWIMALVVVGTIIKDVILVVSTLLTDRLASLSTVDLRGLFFRRTLRMDLATFTEEGTSDLLSRFTYDMDHVAVGIQTVFGRAVREPFKMVACLAGAAWICWRLLFLSLIVVPVAAYLITLLAKTLKRANRKAMEHMSAMYGVVSENLSGIKVVKAFTMERYERRRLHQVSKQCYRRAMRISFFDGLISPVTELMGICTICLAILLGAYLVLNQQTHLGNPNSWLSLKICDRPLDRGSLLVFFAMLAGASDPARKLSEVFNRLQRAAAASDRIYQLLDRQPSITDPPHAVPLGRHHGAIVLDQVSFSYQPEQPVFEDVSLRIEFGETIAIVGPNGCGKSTLANLIPRFFDPTSGTITLDGRDLRSVRLRDLRRQIGLVNQETLLFDDTVLGNIRYGSPHATRQQVIDAAKAAHAHKFIEQKLDHGYETRVGAQGSRLSGGQRQRIALARAILRDPAILILDEATSQIDVESEQLIHKVLEQFTRNRTTIMITHRLSTLALADRIVVMSAGRIEDVGTHHQLVARCETYRRMYQIQFKETA